MMAVSPASKQALFAIRASELELKRIAEKAAPRITLPWAETPPARKTLIALP